MILTYEYKKLLVSMLERYYRENTNLAIHFSLSGNIEEKNNFVEKAINCIFLHSIIYNSKSIIINEVTDLEERNIMSELKSKVEREVCNGDRI